MPRARLALVLTAVLAAACQSSSTTDPRALADEVERVAELLEQDEPCRALDVAEALPVQDEALEAPVRDAMEDFVQQLGRTVQCPPPQPSPTPTATDTEPPPADGDDEDDDEGNGNGDDDDDGGPPNNPGRGNGPGGGNGPGRGND